MRQYLDLLHNILINGKDHEKDRTGHGRRRLFSQTVKFKLRNNAMPVITTRKISPLAGIAEMLFFIGGHTNVSFLNELGYKIWNPWAVDENTIHGLKEKLLKKTFITVEEALTMNEVDEEMMGEIGPMYGRIWRQAPISSQTVPIAAVQRTVEDIPKDYICNMRSYLEEKITAGEVANLTESQKDDALVGLYYGSIDQLNELLLNLKNDPYSSRHLVTAFLPEYTPISGYTTQENVLLGRGALMPCHHSFQVFVNPPEEEGKKPELSLQVNLRSWDVPLGGPTNIHGYAFLAHALAHFTNMEAVELSIVAGDAHIYLDQIEGVELQLTREPYPPSTIAFAEDCSDFFLMKMSDISISSYDQHPSIKYPVAV